MNPTRAITAMAITILTLSLVVVPGSPAIAATTYYVDAVAGSDSNSGTSQSTAWKTSAKVSGAAFNPGDTIRFKRGQTFNGLLTVSSSGLAGAPITYTAYGSGALPTINGSGLSGGDPWAAIAAVDQDHLVFDSLRVTNPRRVSKTGVDDIVAHGLVVKSKTRNLVGFVVTNLVVTEVESITMDPTAEGNNKQSGITFERSSDSYRISDITIENNTINYGTRFGINVTHSDDVIIKGNTCNFTGGSCIRAVGVNTLLISQNSFNDSGTSGHGVQWGNGSGGWIAICTNVVVKLNTSMRSRGTKSDTAGFHIDVRNTNVLMHRNFFYDAQGFGLEILGANENIIVRYNIIIDSGWRTPNGGLVFTDPYNGSFPAKLSNNVHIYDNTFSYATPAQAVKFKLGLTNSYIYNNIFHAGSGASISPLEKLAGSSGNTITHNLFHGAAQAIVNLDNAPVVAAPGFTGGARSSALSFRLATGSPAIGAGISRPHPGFPALGTGIFQDTPNPPTVDYYGNPLPTGTPNIGADQS